MSYPWQPCQDTNEILSNRHIVKRTFYSIINTPNKLLVNVFLATSFGCKFGPSSGHYTGTEKLEMRMFCIMFILETVKWLIYYNWQYRRGRHTNLWGGSDASGTYNCHSGQWRWWTGFLCIFGVVSAGCLCCFTHQSSMVCCAETH